MEHYMQQSNAAEQRAVALADLFGVLANPYRVQILQALCTGELNVTQILERISITPTALSNHLTKLKRNGVVSFRREHRHLFYYISDKRVIDVLDQAALTAA